MTLSELQRYFDRRPKATELHVVGNIVFISPEDAASYAGQMGLTAEKVDRIKKVTRKKAKK